MAAAALRGVHVALAGEDRDALEFLAHSLKYYGALVTVHDSMRSVQRVMQVLLVNVLIVDLGDFIDGGLKMIRNVRALPVKDGGRVPIVAVFVGPPDLEPRIVAEDVDSVIRRPVQAGEFAHVIATVVGASPDAPREL